MNKAKLGIFVQALIFLILGIYLATHGLPSDEGSAMIYVGNEAMDAMSDTTDNPQVDKVANNTKNALAIAGKFLIVFSILELIALFISIFR
jgi:hypothetical protein